MGNIIATCETEPLFLYNPIKSETYSYERPLHEGDWLKQ